MKKSRKDRQRELMKLDTFQHGFKASYDKLKENKKTVFLVFGLLLLVTVGLVIRSKNKNKLELEAFEQSYLLLKDFDVNADGPEGKESKLKKGEQITVIKQIIDKFPNSISAYQLRLRLAKSYYEAGESKKAEKEYQDMLNLKTNNDITSLATLGLAQIKSSNGDDEQARVLLKKVMKNRKSSFTVEAAFLLGKSLIKSGKIADAKEVLGKLNKKELPSSVGSEVKKLLAKY